MIARKPQKFSLNSGETNSEQLHKERASDFSDKPQQTKFASDTATSILEELGVKTTTSNKTNKNSPLNVQRKSSPIKKPILEQSEWDKSLLKDLKNQKAATKNNKVKLDSINAKEAAAWLKALITSKVTPKSDGSLISSHKTNNLGT